MERADVVLVGGGIVGLATARALRTSMPGASVVVLEREQGVGRHQSSHNSGVLHAGVYYAPGSLKAELCRRGKEMMERFCADHGIPVDRNGKLVVATHESELGRFEALVERAGANGVERLAVLDARQLREIEPHAAGIRALHSPTTGVVDFGAVCGALAAGLDVRTGVAVTSVAGDGPDRVVVHTSAGDFGAGAAMVCAGLWSEHLAARSGHRADVRVVPFRGSWTALRPSGAALVRGNLYPVPDPELPFLGVHFTRRIDGAVWAGPNAVVSLSQPALLARAAAFGGSWRLAAAQYRTGATELWTERNRRVALAGMRRYLPELTDADVAWGERPHGVRAQAVDRKGRLVDDFVLARAGRVVHVLNAPSPAATSSLAIADRLAAELAAALG
ncbi:MAG TPA: L-2-hydroxyglutarate oxidase [Acidimicrobiales bacterium]|nr:L-2-hydroxyglutarate oxidase [Acidimicrobiales bacterium]